ncbi:MAG TPA: hypothetical protein VID68_03205 [Solirubrobacteraceae bacterium]
MLVALGALALSACGSQKSTLPPAPSQRADTVAITNLAQHPEVYSDATVATVGSVARVKGRRPALYQLLGGHGARIVLEPSSAAARYDGRRVRASGLFAVSFELGYEILIARIGPAGSL